MYIQFSIIFLITLLLTVLFKKFNQPLVVAYIISGILLGNFFIKSIEFKNLLIFLADIGVTFMLFIVGLELKLKTLREIGKLSIIIGTLQELVTIIAGILFALLLGFNFQEAVYLGIALSFSSTVLMVKLISDKGDLEKFYGKLATGFLLVQDLITVLILMILPFFNLNMLGYNPMNLILGFILVILIPLISYKFLPKLEKFIADNQELLFLFAITSALVLSSLFEKLSLGLEVGALVAGISLSSLKISTEIASKLRPVRDFFLVIFFIYLGLEIFIANIDDIFFKAILLSLFVLIGNPILMWLIVRYLNISKKSAFLLSLTSNQISEFSFIVIGLGISMGHISGNLLSLLSLVGIITFLGSTIIFNKAEKIYEKINRFIPHKEAAKQLEVLEKGYDIILLGCDRIGYSFLKLFEKHKEKVLIVDYNLEKVEFLESLGFNVIYGDASEIEFLGSLNFRNIKLLISTIPDFSTNLLALEVFKKENPQGVFICTAYKVEDALLLYDNGADYVITPHFLGGEHASHIVEELMYEKEKYTKLKEEEIKRLQERIQLGHQHPLS